MIYSIQFATWGGIEVISAMIYHGNHNFVSIDIGPIYYPS